MKAILFPISYDFDMQFIFHKDFYNLFFQALHYYEIQQKMFVLLGNSFRFL